MTAPSGLTRQQIASDLQALGIRPGDVLMVHSSLRSLGHVTGGPGAVVDALLDTIGATGTLVMPAFSFVWDKRTESMTVPPFDRASTPSQMGVVTEEFRTRPGVLRSMHPSHSWCAYGPLAGKVLFGAEGEREGAALDWDQVLAHRCRVLLLGVHHNRSTLMHYVEGLCHDCLPHVPLMYAGGDHPRTKADHGVFNCIEPHLLEAGALTIGHVGQAEARLMDAARVVETAVHVVRTVDRAVLLCDDQECGFCMWARKRYADGTW